MDPQKRQAYLQAMGIDLWLSRTGAAAEPGAAVQESPAGGEAPDEPPPQSTPVAEPVMSPETPGGAAAVSVTGLGFDDLATAVSACTACELHQSRTQTVFGVGNRDADLLFIGEAPGAEEDKRGEPFVGRAGQLLNAMLAGIGMERDAVFIANILKCRPPGNRDPKADEALACSGFLRRQIELIRPRVIVTLGRIAAQNLLKESLPLGRMRNRDFVYADTAIPVIVTYHPAYLLRSPSEKRKAWLDLLKVKKMLEAS